MLGTERLLADGERALEERLGLGVGAGGLVEHGEIVERGRDVGMLGAERLLADGERALVERLGLGVGAGGLVERGEIVERGAMSGCSGPSAFSRIASARW